MADSDHEYDEDDEIRPNGRGQFMATRPKARALARWEEGATGTGDLRQGADGDLLDVLGGIEEAAKRKRSVRFGTLPLFSKPCPNVALTPTLGWSKTRLLFSEASFDTLYSL